LEDDIIFDRESRQKVKGLEDEAHSFGPDSCELSVSEPGHVSTFELDRPPRWLI
jgi:hypothetical protein